jgi:hypothetical protein
MILNIDHIHCDSDSDVEMEDNISSTNNSNSNSEVNTVNNTATSNNSNGDDFREYKITLDEGSEITIKKVSSLENSSPEYLSNTFHRKSMPEVFSEPISIRLSNSNAYTCELNREAVEALRNGEPLIFSVPNETDHTILYDSADNYIKVFRDLSSTNPTLVDEYGNHVITSGPEAPPASPSPPRPESPNPMIFSDDSDGSDDSGDSDTSDESDSDME